MAVSFQGKQFRNGKSRSPLSPIGSSLKKKLNNKSTETGIIRNAF